MLQKPELAPTLSPADVEQLQIRVVDAALQAQRRTATMSGPMLQELIKQLSSPRTAESVVGRTPSQALSTLMEMVRQSRDSVNYRSETDIAWFDAVIRNAAADGGARATVRPEQGTVLPEQGTGKGGAADQKVGSSEGGVGSTGLHGSEKDRSGAATVDELIGQVEALGKEHPVRGELYARVTELVERSRVAGKERILAALKNGQTLDTQGMIDAARKYLMTLERPSDIGCAMSILSWREVQYAFGYLIANEYIAVQVVVRNLNETQQFVLHDVEFEVDADPTGRLGRFYSGRDKVVVRALANTQSTGDPRNITLSVANGIGGLMGAAQLVFGGALMNATGVYTSAFLPALSKGWKDLSSDQLRMIDDNTFSSTASSQMVVPKSGTTVFYTFIPAKQFQEGWWTQPCVEKTYLGTLDENGRLTGLSRGEYELPLRAAKDALGETGNQVRVQDPAAGVDVRRALEVCARMGDSLPRAHSRWGTMFHRGVLLQTEDGQLSKVPSPTAVGTGSAGSGDPTAKAGTDVASPPDCEVQKPQGKDAGRGKPACEQEKAAAGGTFDLFRNAYNMPYKRWSGNSLAIFRELANTVVAGAHIVTDDQLQPAIVQLKCPTDDQGVVDFSKVEKDVLVCTLTGKNLNRYERLRLRSAADAVDPETAESLVTVTGDSTTASVNWKASDLHALAQQNYLVYGVGKSGVEEKTSQAMHLPSGMPWVTTTRNATGSGTIFDFTKTNTPQTLSMTGWHLDRVTGVTLTPVPSAENRKASRIPVDPGGSQTQVSFQLTATALKQVGDGEAQLTLLSEDPANPGRKSAAANNDPGTITLRLTDKKGGSDQAGSHTTKPSKGRSGAPGK